MAGTEPVGQHLGQVGGCTHQEGKMSHTEQLWHRAVAG